MSAAPAALPAGYRLAVLAALLFVCVTLASFTVAPRAEAKPVCKSGGLVHIVVSSVCTAVRRGRRLLNVGKKVVTGDFGGAVGAVAGAGVSAAAGVGLGAVSDWAANGAKFALDETAKLISATTSPRMAAPWFTRVYWRVAGVATLLTLPFLTAAAVQALLRSDLTLLLRSAFGYLPLAMLAVNVAAQLTGMLLAATDELCALVSGAAGDAAPAFLSHAAAAVLATSAGSGSPFLVFLVSVFTVAGAIVLWLELMIRDASVYVIVAMLPLTFAALVWPARRVWALRAVELLTALILSKLAIITVLTLGGAALDHGSTITGYLAGLTLLILSVFAPWAMLRLIPFAELASGAVGHMRQEAGAVFPAGRLAESAGGSAHNWAADTTARMRRFAQQGAGAAPGEGPRSASPQDGEPASAARAQADNLNDSASATAGADSPSQAGSDPDQDSMEAYTAAAAATESVNGGGRGGGNAPRGGDGNAPRGGDGNAPSGGEGNAPSGGGGNAPGGGDVNDNGDADGTIAGEPDSPGASDERIPGMGPLWQKENFSWRPIHLGRDGEWPPAPLPADEAEDGPLSASGESADLHGNGSGPDADRKPPPQPSEGGPL